MLNGTKSGLFSENIQQLLQKEKSTPTTNPADIITKVKALKTKINTKESKVQQLQDNTKRIQRTTTAGNKGIDEKINLRVEDKLQGLK